MLLILRLVYQKKYTIESVKRISIAGKQDALEQINHGPMNESD